MTDFASSAMVRVLAQGMRQLGLAPPPGLDLPAGGDALVALDHKRTLVMAALQQGGIGSLALLGRGLARFRDEPTHQALVSARSASDLFARWRRLERYIHSRHRLVVESVDDTVGSGHAVLRHESRHGPPPLPVEDLVVLGVLVALLEELGLQEVHAYVDDVKVVPDVDAQALADKVRAAQISRWMIRWSGAVRAPATGSRLQRQIPPAVASTLWVESAWPELACQAAQCLAQDLARPLPVAELAAKLSLSTRTLQRSLGAAGLNYTTVLAQTRCRAASWWLIHSDMALAEVGFVCGYADQSHLTRDFRFRVGLPPAAFRDSFAKEPYRML